MPSQQGIAAETSTQTSTKSRETNTSVNIDVQELLAMNGMPIGDISARDVQGFDIIMENAKVILNGERNSPNVGGHDKTYWQKLHVKYEARNEQTYRDMFFTPFMGQDRNVKAKDEAWGKRAWSWDGLDINSNQPFYRKSLPKVNTFGNGQWEKLLNSKTNKRVKNPVPDLAYALDTSHFTKEELSILMNYSIYAGISKKIWCPTVIIEFNQGDMRRPKTQCARGGAALVNANRQLCMAGGRVKDVPGADTETVVYSFAMTHQSAVCSVHWANVTMEPANTLKTTFHMHSVGSWMFDYGNDGIFDQRKALNNLLGYLVGERKSWVKILLADIRRRGLPDIPATIPLETGENDEGDNDEDEGYGGGDDSQPAPARRMQGSAEGEREEQSDHQAKRRRGAC